MTRLTRRRYVAVAGTAGLVGTTTLSGCLSEGDDGGDEEETDSPTDTPADESGFHVEGIDFAASEPAGYDEYTPQPDDTFLPGDRVWFYFDVRQVTADEGAVSLTLEITIEPPADSELDPLSDERTYTEEFGDRSVVGKLYLSRGFDLNADIPDGEYGTEATVTDDEAGESDTISGSFHVES